MLTEVKKKSKKKQSFSAKSDDSTDAESTGDFGSTIPSPVFDGVARGRPLGDDSDTDEEPSSLKNVHSSRGDNEEQPSPKKKNSSKNKFQSYFTS